MTQRAEHGTIAIPEATSTQTATSLEDCDQAVADVAAHAKEWYDATPAELIPLLRRLVDAVQTHSQRWVEVAMAAKHITPGTPLEGEDWSNGPAPTARYLTSLIASLTDIAAGRRPKPPGAAHPVEGDRTAIPVFPVNAVDKAALTGFTQLFNAMSPHGTREPGALGAALQDPATW